MVEEEEIRIFGKVTDFANNPLQGAIVEVKNDRFEAIYKTRTNSAGEYKISVKKGLYMALVAYKDYKIKYLEYWAWNLPAYQDLHINPHIGGIEVYALNAFRPQGAYPSLIIYFRPMSLKRYQEFEKKKTGKKIDIIDIAPDLSKDDIKVKINNKPVKILELNRVKEYAGGVYSLIAYLAQLPLPKRLLIAYLIQAAFHLKLPKSEGKIRYTRIDVTVRDPYTEEKGESCLFWKATL
ncbi:MAG: carboxypeptidase-like regulatory domain-containing protein [Fervidobacterium sp.]